jgi:hypothetical protein
MEEFMNEEKIVSFVRNLSICAPEISIMVKAQEHDHLATLDAVSSSDLYSSATVAVEYADGEIVLVPYGTRTLQFIQDNRDREIPVAAFLISGQSFLTRKGSDWILRDVRVRYISFSEVGRAQIQKKIEADSKLFFRFIPVEYRCDRGVTTEEIFSNNPTQFPILCSDLVEAMRSGEYWGSYNTPLIWNREAMPVEFTRGRGHNAILWFYDGEQAKWLGWEGDEMNSSLRVVGDLDKPDFVSDVPKNSVDFYTDPIFQGVSLEKFFGFVSSVFWIEGEVKTPLEFAEAVAARPYQSWGGCASFYAIPTPQNEWGWGYETVSGRQLMWLPGDTVFTRGLRESQNFRDVVEGALGAVIELAEPEWLKAAFTLALVVDRPSVSEYGQAPSEAKNEGFFAAISRKPLEVYEGTVRPSVAQVHSYDFFAAQEQQAVTSREERMQNALQTLLNAAKK